MKAIKKWLNIGTTIILYALLLCMIVIVLSAKAAGGEPKVFGYQIKTVLSGSMEPGIKTGSVITVKPGGDMTRFKENDIITFHDQAEDVLITHRVIDVINNDGVVMYKTKGDNNDAADRNPVLSDHVVAEYTGITIPYVGYFMNFAQSKNGSIFLLILPGVLLLGYAIYQIWTAIKQIDAKEKIVS
ncbi:signal peptidase I SipW [Bacillus chungangensis]|uniref:Signal peptidase I n=1 Tax=Bacillus chungangensis TaxID=587633 RepID=A0ABT9WP53_9BACI|nr:signal peptidase I [Bacillus chungangensis]MDQ0175063.1 signal peptidase [Bacillus chungangensis]